MTTIIITLASAVVLAPAFTALAGMFAACFYSVPAAVRDRQPEDREVGA